MNRTSTTKMRRKSWNFRYSFFIYVYLVVVQISAKQVIYRHLRKYIYKVCNTNAKSRYSEIKIQQPAQRITFEN